jgi:dihydroorotase
LVLKKKGAEKDMNLQAKGKERFDVLLKDGEIIDPAQGIHFAGSLAVKEGRIAALGKDLSGEAQKVIPLQGKIIAPGLIDLHCHPSLGFLWRGIPPDEVGLNSGVTLLGDGGTAGAANFHAFRKLVVEPAETEILCFLNVAKTGLISQPEISSLRDMDVDRGKEVVEANRDRVRGIKIRAIQSLADGLGIQGIEMAKKMANDLKMPLMIHIGNPRERMEKDRMDDFSRQAVSLLEKGDILSHYLTWEPGGLILEDGTVYPELENARQRGVILDSCHGLWHFSFTIARHALKQGLKPDVISTDMSIPNIMVTQSLPVVMSKFLNLGLSLEEVIAMTTLNAARVLKEEEKRGSLRPGLPADITILELLKGDFLFGDGKGRGSLRGNLLLEPRMVLKAAEIKPAYSRYHIPPLYQ